MEKFEWGLAQTTNELHDMSADQLNDIGMNDEQRDAYLHSKAFSTRQSGFSERTRWIIEFTGWLVFILSAVLYSYGAIRIGDMLSLAAAMSFMTACIMFLIPCWTNRPRRP